MNDTSTRPHIDKVLAFYHSFAAGASSRRPFLLKYIVLQ